MATFLDDVNQFIHEAVSLPKRSPSKTREERTSSLIVLAFAAWFVVGLFGIGFAAGFLTPWLCVLYLPWIIGVIVIVWFGVWYDTKYDIG